MALDSRIPYVVGYETICDDRTVQPVVVFKTDLVLDEKDPGYDRAAFEELSKAVRGHGKEHNVRVRIERG